MATMRIQKLEVIATHEPNPLILSISPNEGEGARRADEGDSQRFMAPTHVNIWEVFALPLSLAAPAQKCVKIFPIHGLLSP
jgi:hypothetical protein